MIIVLERQTEASRFSSFTATAPQEIDNSNSNCIAKYKACSTCMVMAKFTCWIAHGSKDQRCYQDCCVKE